MSPTPDIGQAAPTFNRQPIFGYTIDSADLTSERPLVLAFLRYPGSSTTRATLTELATIWPTLDYNDISMLAVIEGDLDALQDLVPRFHLKFPVIHDDGGLYEQYGVGRDASITTAAKSLTPSKIKALINQTLQTGRGMLNGHYDRLPAVFVIGVGGEIEWRWDASTFTDTPKVQEIEAAALSAVAK